MNEIIFQRLLALVNSALWNKKIDENLFIPMDDKLWDDLYRLSIRNGVMAIAFDGLTGLPSNLQPSLKLRMAWGLSTEQIEQKYAHILTVATELKGLFQQEHIDMLIFKGLSLSAYYPIPSHREFGDIDIYLFGEYKKGDLLMDKLGAKKKDQYDYKHSSYYYKNILIENHACFLNVRESKKILRLNQQLLDILKGTQTRQEEKLLFPSPEFTALFFIIHAISHLSVNVLPLRTYCDWALFLQTHAQKLDMDRWKKSLHDAGLLDLAETFTTLAFRWMEISPATLFPIQEHSEREDQVYKEMLQPFYSQCQSTNIWKIRIHSYKRHKLFYNCNFFAYCFKRLVSLFMRYLFNIKKQLSKLIKCLSVRSSN